LKTILLRLFEEDDAAELLSSVSDEDTNDADAAGGVADADAVEDGDSAGGCERLHRRSLFRQRPQSLQMRQELAARKFRLNLK